MSNMDSIKLASRPVKETNLKLTHFALNSRPLAVKLNNAVMMNVKPDVSL